jgi:hypothetical protein
MKTHGWLGHVVMRTSGSVGSVPRETSTEMVRARVTRTILLLALVVGSLGAASASSGHGGAGLTHAGARQTVGSHAVLVGTDSMSSSPTKAYINMPWMY